MNHWPFRCIDTMSRSRDQALSQQFLPSIPGFCKTLASLHTNYLTYCGPYDDPASYGAKPGWQAAWLSAIRATGNHVWFRMIWNHWSGTFNQPIYAYNTTPAVPAESAGRVYFVLNGQDTTSYLAQTFNYILNNPDIFEDGDVFTPISEPQDVGILPWVNSSDTPQFPDITTYNHFIQDITTLCRVAFYRINKQVFVGLMAAGYVAGSTNYLTADTVRVIGSPNSIDDYATHPVNLVNALGSMSASYQSAMILGEWGAQSSTTEADRVDAVNALYSQLATLPFLLGTNYFEAWSYPDSGESSGDGLLDPTTLAVLPHGQAVGQWFKKMAPNPSNFWTVGAVAAGLLGIGSTYFTK